MVQVAGSADGRVAFEHPQKSQDTHHRNGQCSRYLIGMMQPPNGHNDPYEPDKPPESQLIILTLGDLLGLLKLLLAIYKLFQSYAVSWLRRFRFYGYETAQP